MHACMHEYLVKVVIFNLRNNGKSLKFVPWERNMIKLGFGKLPVVGIMYYPGAIRNCPP